MYGHCFPQILVLLSQLTVVTYGLNFYVGDGDQNEIKNHYMFNRSIGIYHRRQPDLMKFCVGKSVGFYSMGMCKNFYAFCNDDNSVSVTRCANGEVYREEENRCVDQSLEPRCLNVHYAVDHQLCADPGHTELVALEDCSHTYGVCHHGSIYFVDCPTQTQSFSAIYGTCVPKRENPSCDQYDHDQGDQKAYYHLAFTPLSSMCQDSTSDDHNMYFGPCNRRYLLCGQGGYAFVGECPGQDTVADAPAGGCVQASQSSACPAQWGSQTGEVHLVQYMAAILEATRYCAGKSNGVYYDPHSDCKREGIFCFEGKGSFHICPPGQGIDGNGWCSLKDSCWLDEGTGHNGLWQSSFLTSFAADAQLCQPTESDGMHIFGLCQRFHGRCRMGQFEIHACQLDGEIFDAELSRCVHPDESKQCKVYIGQDDQSTSTPPINRCSSPDINVASKFVPTGVCQPSFLVCMNGWEVVFKCEKKEHAFSEQWGTCVPRVKHPDCPEYVIEETSTTAIATTKKQLTCQGDGGFHVHQDDCTKFYRCAHGRMVEMSCPEATAFDPSINVCNHKHLVARCNEEKGESLF